MKRFLPLLLIVFVSFLYGCHKKNVQTMPDMPAGTSGSPSEPMPPDITQNQDSSSVDLDELTRKFQPVFFDFNKFEIRNDQVSALQANATLLRAHPNANVVLEGHCDERGTDEYNLALGERRAKVVREYLVNLGVDPNRLQTISYGESRPYAYGHNEDSWQQNRRAQSVVLKQQ